MGAHASLYRALATPLEPIAAIYNTSWENDGRDTAFLAEEINLTFRHIPAGSYSEGIGADAKNRWIGFVQIKVYAPAGAGALAALDVVDSIRAIYRRGVDFAHDTVEVRIEKLEQNPGSIDRGWYVVPLTIWYRASSPAVPV